MLENFSQLIDELRSLPNETEWVEFKENYGDPKGIGEYISAVSNSATIHSKNFGYIVFGIEDKTHSIVGTTFQPKLLKKNNQELESWLYQMLSPHPAIEFLEGEVDSKRLVVLKVAKALSAPVKFDGAGYIRIGSTTRKLSDFVEQERILWQLLSGMKFEDGLVANGVSIDTLVEAIDLQAYFELMELPIPSSFAEMIQKFLDEGLLIESGRNFDITNVCAILFAKNLNVFPSLKRKAVRVILYKNDDKTDTLRELIGNKGYAVGFTGLIDTINSQLPSHEMIKGALREKVEAYPEIAIREVVANALIHQDFLLSGTSIMIEIFSNRLEVSNPGKSLVNPMRFIDHNPHSRNEKLAHLMRRMNICEERGSGIDKVIKSIEQSQLPAPLFTSEEQYTKAFLYFRRTLSELTKEDKIRATYQHACVKYEKKEFMTNASLRERFGIEESNYSIASRIIRDTIEAGLIKAQDPLNKANKHAKYVPFYVKV